METVGVAHKQLFTSRTEIKKNKWIGCNFSAQLCLIGLNWIVLKYMSGHGQPPHSHTYAASSHGHTVYALHQPTQSDHVMSKSLRNVVDGR